MAKGISGLPPEGPGPEGTMTALQGLIQSPRDGLPGTRGADINEKSLYTEDVVLSPYVGSTTFVPLQKEK